MGPIEGFLPYAPQIQGESALNENPTATPQEGIEAFSALFEGALTNANKDALAANAAAEAFASGARDDIHGTMLALSKADIELRVLGTARNKIVDAFYELWRMQV
ncbi:MAG: flagellar hook-basal body complex protein FliE [Polyangiaceae bacterium]|nr:flagellar hook-basal body complex protein FliE [Polyangiaceae bacterium]